MQHNTHISFLYYCHLLDRCNHSTCPFLQHKELAAFADAGVPQIGHSFDALLSLALQLILGLHCVPAFAARVTSRSQVVEATFRLAL